MKRWIPVVAAFVLLFSVFIATAQPDLVVTAIDLTPPSPVAGDEVTITATVENVGTDPAGRQFSVRISIDDFPVTTPSIPRLGPGEARTVSATWTAEVGMHTITVVADQPFDRIQEGNERNNTLVATVSVPVSPDAAALLSSIKVAVARFDDRSSSGFVNVGAGVADELIDRLVNSGVRVLERSELEAVMQERGLNPALTSDLATASRLLGADLLIVGSVTKVNVSQASLSLGFFKVSNASVEVSMTARLVNAYTSEIMDSVTASGSEQGTTGFSVDLGRILSLTQPQGGDVCAGGLRTDKPYYSPNETVRIGYKNPGPPKWFGIEIYRNGGPFLRWLDWQFVPTGGCGIWFWDQRDAANIQMGPGIYTAKLWDGTSYIATINFQIRPGSGPIAPLIDEITVGSDRFDETIVGKAINRTLNQLVARLIDGIVAVAPQLSSSMAARAESPATPAVTLEGQVAALLPDGRVVINIGANAGVRKGDFFQVLDTENVITDPTTGKILSYDVRGVKGEIVIVEVRDRVAYGVKTSNFAPIVGDIVRPSG